MSSENSMSNPVVEREALGISAQTPLVQGDIVDQFVIFHNFCFFKSLVLNYG